MAAAGATAPGGVARTVSGLEAAAACAAAASVGVRWAGGLAADTAGADLAGASARGAGRLAASVAPGVDARAALGLPAGTEGAGGPTAVVWAQGLEVPRLQQ